MRCDEVIRELAVPTAGRDDLAVSLHLADCEACARQAALAAAFDRLWQDTRPAEPAPETWDNLWSSVAAKLDQPSSSPVTATYARSIHVSGSPLKAAHSAGGLATPRRGRLWSGLAAAGIIGLAQAAALLIALGVSWRTPVRPPSVTQASQIPQIAVISPNPAMGVDSVVEVEEGQVVLIRSDGPEVRVDDLTAQEVSNGVDEWYLFFNVLEPMAKSVVAMTE